MTNDARADASKIHTYVIASYPGGVVRKTMPCGRSAAYVEAAYKELGRSEELYVTWEDKRYRVTRP